MSITMNLFFVIYAIFLVVKYLDNKLQEFTIINREHRQFISFSSTESNKRLEVLHLNNMNNKKGHFKVLHNINAYDEAELNRKIEQLRDLLLNAKVDNILLFCKVE